MNCRLVFLLLLTTPLMVGCLSASYTETGGGDSGADASHCITIDNDQGAEQASVSNRCDVTVNFLEFSTGSSGLLTISALSTETQQGIIAAWGACVAPETPQRTGDFEYYCS